MGGETDRREGKRSTRGEKWEREGSEIDEGRREKGRVILRSENRERGGEGEGKVKGRGRRKGE